MSTLRERKRERTRAAIVAAGTDLFARQGYDETTIADIAAAADIGTRTFFGYFDSKEALLFPASDRRVEIAAEAIASRNPHEHPVDVLLRALAAVDPAIDELTSPTAVLRMRLMEMVPAVRGRALQIQRHAQQEIARRLVQAYPSELDLLHATALAGAYIGAVASALEALFDLGGKESDPATTVFRLRASVAYALGASVPADGCG